MQIVDYNKYENYIKVGNDANNLKPFPTPSSIGYALYDVDKDAFTDLEGYTHRNRVRHDVVGIELGYGVLSDADLSFILNAISNSWIYIELTDKKQVNHTIDENEYWKLIGKSDEATYWYDNENGVIYDNSYSTTGVSQDINDYSQEITPVRTVHKVYASDKKFDSFRIIHDESGYHEIHEAFTVTLTEE